MNFSTLQQHLLTWFAGNRRDLPWRATYDPYQVWISEIMAQQTQMERVVSYFNRWMDAFPNVAAVAVADEHHVLKLWEGLGYYSRARNLQKSAKIITEKYAEKIPDDMESLLSLPGIGPYTAAAILSIGYNLPHPVMDANVLRITARLIDIETPIMQSVSRKKAEHFLNKAFFRENPRDFNQAMMEFGALVCTPKNPSCVLCPLQTLCRAYRIGTVDQRPVPGKKEVIIPIEMACGVIRHQGRYYIQQRRNDDVWPGLWEFPGGRLEKGETPEEAAIREIYEETELAVEASVLLQTVRHSYTRYRVTLHAYACRLSESILEPVLHAADYYQWVLPEKLAEYPFPAGHRQLIPLLLRSDIVKKFR